MSANASTSAGEFTQINLLEHLENAIHALAESPNFSKATKTPRLYDTVRRVLNHEGGFGVLESYVERIEQAGIFYNTDYANPQILMPALSIYSFKSHVTETVLIETLSNLRLLAISKQQYSHPEVSAEQAHHYLTQVLAVNLQMMFSVPDEVEREKQGQLGELSRKFLTYLAESIGYEHIIERLIDEIWRLLQQRPIQVDNVKQMVTQIAICQQNPEIDLGQSGHGADRLISSLYGATQASREDPGVAVYLERLKSMDDAALNYEATGFARAMHDTGLASPYHAVLIRFLSDRGDNLLSEALGLSSTGRDCLLTYNGLVRELIDKAVHPATAQAIYGLALLLERCILYQSPVAPSLWRQLSLTLSAVSDSRIRVLYGDDPTPQAKLLEGVLCVLGQPLGVGQGNNPTCQSARAISMWAYNDPDYLLQLIVSAARDDEVIIHFEGQAISSKESLSGIAKELPMDLDPVSLILVPHLDRIYAEMGRRCAGREGDPHRWVNPEFHGWWCGRGFSINVDVVTGKLIGLDHFLRLFYASYHPYYNGNQQLIHPQPAGIAITDSALRFIGWHAIAILRVGLDQNGVMRVYFYNPNNDSGQNWGDGIEVSTAGHSERFGEASLPFEEFVSRLYIFHYDPLEPGSLEQIPESDVNLVSEKIFKSWGKSRL